MKIVLHTCCAPCAIFPLKVLREEGWELLLYFYNPNIHPFGEFLLRKETVENFAQKESLEVVCEDYGLREFLQAVDLKENRCLICYRLRLDRTARFAKEKGISHFTTTLLVSPYQNQEKIREIGEEVAKAEGLSFLYRDFRSGYWEGVRISKELGMYRQKYCGCIFSEEEALRQRLARKQKKGGEK